MKFLDAVKLAEMNSHLIGKNTMGGRIDEIIIYPTDPALWEEFKVEYCQSGDAQSSAGLFIEYDVRVGVIIDKFLIEENGTLIKSDIAELENELGAILA